MRKLIATAAVIAAAVMTLALSAAPAAAQNVICATAPLGDNSNRCASTAFVQNAVAISATAPLQIAANVISLNIDSNFAVSGGNLALAPIASGNLVANCTGGSAEPTTQTLTACLDRNLGSTAGFFAVRGASTWAGRLIVGADLPNPSPTTLGGVFSLAVTSNSVLSGIGTDGVPTRATTTGTGDVVRATSPSITSPNFVTSFLFGTKLYDEAGALRTFYHPDGSAPFLQWNATAAFVKSDTTTWSSSDGVTTFGSISSGALSVLVPTVVTSASANALAVGRLGTTTPAFSINAATASSITGINIAAGAAGGGVALAAIGETNVQLNVDAAGAGKIVLNAVGTGNVQSGRNVDLTGNSTPTITFGSSGSVAAKLLATGTAGVIDLFNGGGRMARFNGAASLVNYLDVTAGASGGGVLFKAVGGDSDVAINFSSFGAGAVGFLTNNASVFQLQVQHTASANRYLTITGSNGGNPTIGVSGGTVALTDGTGTSTVPATNGVLINTGSVAAVTNTMLAGSIDLTTKVAGALPVANGGTNLTSTSDVSATPYSRALSIQNSGDTNDSSSGSGSFRAYNLTYTVPASFMVAARVIRVTAHFRLTTGTVPTALDVQLKYGSTVVALLSGPNTPTASQTNLQYTLTWITQAVAAPGASVNTETAMISNINGLAAPSTESQTAQPVALATNGTLAITVESKWAGAGTGVNQAKLSQIIVEALN